MRLLTHTWHLARRAYRPEVRIFIFSLLIYSPLAVLFPTSFYPDSEQYVRTARALSFLPSGEFYYYRTIGYPIFMVISGVTAFETFWPLLLLQLLTAALIPALCYSAIAPLGRRLAMLSASAIIISFAPALYWRTIMTDQIAMFFRIALIYLATVSIFGTRERLLNYVLLGLTGFILYLLRPSDTLTFMIIPVAMLVWRIGDWRKPAALAAAFVAAIFISGMARDALATWYTKRHEIRSTSVVGSMMGRMLFFNAYAVGPKIAGEATISPENGPNSRRLVEALIDWGRKNPMGVKSYSTQGASAYPTVYANVTSAEDFAKALVKEEGLFAHSVMWLALDQQLGAETADRVFLGAAIEAYIAHPKALLLLYDGMVEFFFAGDVVYNAGRKETWNWHPESLSVYVPPAATFAPGLRSELQYSADHQMEYVALLGSVLFTG